MDFPMNFIAATTEYSTLTKYVPAPYLRKSFVLEKKPQKASVVICGLGFYELYVNGERITKGFLAPYISNPDNMIYYDAYDVTDRLTAGENVVGVCLGNGFQNSPGGYHWDFDKARWRGAPQTALRLDVDFGEGITFSFESDESFKTAPSPILFDDLHNGEYYDARKEQPGWCTPGFDDSAWQSAIKAPMPRGETRLCEAEPIRVQKELPPVSIKAFPDGYLYDFGVNCAGLSRLTINGTAGQEITLFHGELLVDGLLDIRHVATDKNDFSQKDIYICKGSGTETYTPSFTYHGFRYVLVQGLTAEQAVPETLTCLVMNSDIKERGGFSCSDETINTLQTFTRRSTLANFYYFPTDCPQREKNGWTGDAALSAEHILLNLEAEKSFAEWMRNIRKSQADNGLLPGLVPTAGFGYWWGNGPAWDCVLVYLPYFTYMYRGDTAILKENVHAIFRYLEYLHSKIREDGLLCFGLGDWAPAGRRWDSYKSPLYFTDTVYGMDICEKAAAIFSELDLPLHREFAVSLGRKLRAAARERLLNLNTMTAEGRCQTSQAMAIFYNLFEPAEKQEAFKVLLNIIKEADDHIDMGILGDRVLFHVLADFGHTDLALYMMTRPDFPSYGWWIQQGAASLWENFTLESGTPTGGSLNHHFRGDISHFFIRHLAGINYNTYTRAEKLEIYPKFVQTLTHAEGFHLAPEGEIRVRWQRQEAEILLTVTVPDSLKGNIRLPSEYLFEDGVSVKPAVSGEYFIKKISL